MSSEPVAPSRPRPLADLRIVSVEQYAAGPYGTLQLAELGADVIKVEDPRTDGDIGRYVLPFSEGEDSLFFESFNRGKRSISLDLGDPDGRRVFEDLVRTADAVSYNLRGDVPERLGLTYEHLRHVNPRIVCCSLSGFGLTGPRSAEPAYDYILQGLTGWMSVTGEPGGPPTKSGLSVVDFASGVVLAASLLAGVHAARRDGVGMDCDVSLFDTAVSMLTYQAAWHLNGGFEPTRRRHSGHPSLVPFQNFETSDGWIVVGCAKEKFWQRMTEVVDPDLAADPRYEGFPARRTHEDELLAHLDGVFRTRSSAEWLDVLGRAGVPCGPVNDVAAALRDEQVDARAMVVTTEHPRFGRVRQVAAAVRVGDAPRVTKRAPLRNEDAHEILRDVLGYDDDAVAALEQTAAFGTLHQPA